MKKFYAITNVEVAPVLVLADATSLDWETAQFAKTNNCTWVSLEEAIKTGAQATGARGFKAWVGVNLKCRMNEHVLEFWWLGKWRGVTYYNYLTRKPSKKFVQEALERVARLNCPLDPKTIILWYWEV